MPKPEFVCARISACVGKQEIITRCLCVHACTRYEDEDEDEDEDAAVSAGAGAGPNEGAWGGHTMMAATREVREAKPLRRMTCCRATASPSSLSVTTATAHAPQDIRIMDTAGTDSSCCTCPHHRPAISEWCRHGRAACHVGGVVHYVLIWLVWAENACLVTAVPVAYTSI